MDFLKFLGAKRRFKDAPTTAHTPKQTKETIVLQPSVPHLVSQYDEHLPWFLKPKFIQDADCHSINDPNYDPNTLYIPPDECSKFTPIMSQYWKIKQQHFSKIVFFQLGKFYELFYTDAIIGNLKLDLNWMGNPKNLHVGFMQNSKDKFVSLFVNLGYDVVIVDQQEDKHGDLRQREVTQIVSRGMLQQFEWIMFFDGNSVLLFTYQGLLALIQHNVSEDQLRFQICSKRPVDLLYTSNSWLWVKQTKFATLVKPQGSVIGLLHNHLHSAMQSHIIPDLDIQILDEQGALQLDSSALAQLEIHDSFFKYLDYTSSHAGKRMLREWVCAPLKCVFQINQRQQAVQCLIRNQEAITLFQAELQKLPDIERLVSHTLCNVSLKQLPQQRLKELFLLLSTLKQLKQAIAAFTYTKIEAQLLRELLKSMPDLDAAIGEFEALIVWHQVGLNERVPEPVRGFDSNYDQCQDQLKLSNQNLQEYLQGIRTRVSGKKHLVKLTQSVPLEIEIPEGVKFDRPADFELSSKRQGVFRYTSDQLCQLEQSLQQHQDDLQEALKPFIKSIFDHFRSKKHVWQKVIQIVSQIDCLCALALVTINAQGPMCSPQFVSDKCFKVCQLRHPCVTFEFRLTQGTKFIPNDVDLSSPILLSGPNMGGKSTLLRSIALSVILAQIGCQVPAVSMQLSIVDKVFTRLGGTDDVLTGKSTFFCEMEETQHILTQSTAESLVLIDELGRGTSTYDGQAIAEAVLKFLVARGPRLVFSTHYHSIQDTVAASVNVCRMGVQCGASEITYLYRLESGACHSSYGLNVARIAGLPYKVLSKGEAMCAWLSNQTQIN